MVARAEGEGGSTAGKGKIEWGRSFPVTATATAAATDPARLPEGWQSAVDTATGATYYYNEQGASQWERPL